MDYAFTYLMTDKLQLTLTSCDYGTSNNLLDKVTCHVKLI